MSSSTACLVAEFPTCSLGRHLKIMPPPPTPSFCNPCLASFQHELDASRKSAAPTPWNDVFFFCKYLAPRKRGNSPLILGNDPIFYWVRRRLQGLATATNSSTAHAALAVRRRSSSSSATSSWRSGAPRCRASAEAKLSLAAAELPREELDSSLPRAALWATSGPFPRAKGGGGGGRGWEGRRGRVGKGGEVAPFLDVLEGFEQISYGFSRPHVGRYGIHIPHVVSKDPFQQRGPHMCHGERAPLLGISDGRQPLHRRYRRSTSSFLRDQDPKFGACRAFAFVLVSLSPPTKGAAGSRIEN